MGGKFSPVIIIVLLLVVVAIGLFAYSTLVKSSGSNHSDTKTSVEDGIKPTLNLKKEKNEDGSYIIYAEAQIEDDSGIDYITLPDGDIVKDVKAEYEATENGEYKFTVTAVNGASSSSKIEVTDIPEPSASNPYIPEGFSHLKGEVDDGYIIVDDYGNQFVWVPVTSGKMKRNTGLDTKYEETDNAATALVNSVAKYYGFYIGRFEASEYELEGKKVAATMQGKVPWTNISYLDAADYATNAARDFGYSDTINTSLISSYAWDTVVAWIDEATENYSSSLSYGNFECTVLPTGTYENDENEGFEGKLRSVCDIAGNVKEWTTEKYLEKPSTSTNNKNKKNNNNNTNTDIYRVVRGGSADLSRTPLSHVGYPENTSDAYWGFRIVLYK